MTQFRRRFFVVLLLASSLGQAGIQATTNQPPSFSEVYDLIQAHLDGATEADLNRAAVEGLLANLRGKAMLVGSEAAPANSNATVITKSSVLDDGVAYVRVAQVADDLANQLSSAYQQLATSNKLKGVVLDLRYADGEDYAAAAGTADLFLAKRSRLLDWGHGIFESKGRTNAVTVPVAVLVNRETSGAAEALAAVLRETGAGLILGNTTAGRAMIMRDFPLKNGQLLRIATTPIKLGDGSLLTLAGLKPDIEVTVNADDERMYYSDAYAKPARTNELEDDGLSLTNQPNETNRPAHKLRLSEADLVREKREGITPDEDITTVRNAEPEKPVIRDPALARAVDLLKGLAVVRQTR